MYFAISIPRANGIGYVRSSRGWNFVILEASRRSLRISRPSLVRVATSSSHARSTWKKITRCRGGVRVRVSRRDIQASNHWMSTFHRARGKANRFYRACRSILSRLPNHPLLCVDHRSRGHHHSGRAPVFTQPFAPFALGAFDTHIRGYSEF